MKLTPHGPANAVLVAAAIHAHGPGGSGGGGGITRVGGMAGERARHVGLGSAGSDLPGGVAVVAAHASDQIGAALDARGSRGVGRARRGGLP